MSEQLAQLGAKPAAAAQASPPPFDASLVERFNPFVPGAPYDRARLVEFQTALTRAINSYVSEHELAKNLILRESYNKSYGRPSLNVMIPEVNAYTLGQLFYLFEHATLAEGYLQIASFIIENVSVPPEVEQAIDKRSSMAAVGNLNDYVKFQMAQGLALATVRCSCDYLAELEAFDQLVIRMRLGGVVQNRITLNFEYWRENGEGEISDHGGGHGEAPVTVARVTAPPPGIRHGSPTGRRRRTQNPDSVGSNPTRGISTKR